MRKLSDKEIAKKKGRTISKHYSISINGKQQKILNYKVQIEKNDEKLETLELISKFKFPDNLNTDKIISVIIDKGKRLHFEGTFSFSAMAIGNYSLGIVLKK